MNYNGGMKNKSVLHSTQLRVRTSANDSVLEQLVPQLTKRLYHLQKTEDEIRQETHRLRGCGIHKKALSRLRRNAIKGAVKNAFQGMFEGVFDKGEWCEVEFFEKTQKTQ